MVMPTDVPCSPGFAVSMRLFYRGTSDAPGEALLDALPTLAAHIAASKTHGTVRLASAALRSYETDSMQGTMPPAPPPLPPQPPTAQPPPPPVFADAAGPVPRTEICSRAAMGRVIAGRRLSSIATCAGNTVESPGECCESCSSNAACRGWFSVSGSNCVHAGIEQAATLCYLLSDIAADYSAVNGIRENYMAAWT